MPRRAAGCEPGAGAPARGTSAAVLAARSSLLRRARDTAVAFAPWLWVLTRAEAVTLNSVVLFWELVWQALFRSLQRVQVTRSGARGGGKEMALQMDQACYLYGH